MSVLNDYVQFRFDGDQNRGHVVLNSSVWSVVRQDDRLWREQGPGYADALRRLAPGTVVWTTEETRPGVLIALETGTIVIHPAKEETFVEIADSAVSRVADELPGARPRTASKT